MCLEAGILTCGHEYHNGSLIISFCTFLRPKRRAYKLPEHEQDKPHHTMWNRSDEDNKFTTTAGLAVSVATLTPT